MGGQDADYLAFGQAVLGGELAGRLGGAVVGGDTGVADCQEGLLGLGELEVLQPAIGVSQLDQVGRADDLGELVLVGAALGGGNEDAQPTKALNQRHGGL